MATKKPQKLTAETLKNALWETLQDVRSGKSDVYQADAVAKTAREIIKTTNTQLRVSQQSKRDVPASVIAFSESE